MSVLTTGGRIKLPDTINFLIRNKGITTHRFGVSRHDSLLRPNMNTEFFNDKLSFVPAVTPAYKICFMCRDQYFIFYEGPAYHEVGPTPNV